MRLENKQARMNREKMIDGPLLSRSEPWMLGGKYSNCTRSMNYNVQIHVLGAAVTHSTQALTLASELQAAASCHCFLFFFFFPLGF